MLHLLWAHHDLSKRALALPLTRLLLYGWQNVNENISFNEYELLEAT